MMPLFCHWVLFYCPSNYTPPSENIQSTKGIKLKISFLISFAWNFLKTKNFLHFFFLVVFLQNTRRIISAMLGLKKKAGKIEGLSWTIEAEQWVRQLNLIPFHRKLSLIEAKWEHKRSKQTEMMNKKWLLEEAMELICVFVSCGCLRKFFTGIFRNSENISS